MLYYMNIISDVTLSKVSYSVLSEVAHPYYVVFRGCRERGKRTIFAVAKSYHLKLEFVGGRLV